MAKSNVVDDGWKAWHGVVPFRRVCIRQEVGVRSEEVSGRLERFFCSTTCVGLAEYRG